MYKKSEKLIMAVILVLSISITGLMTGCGTTSKEKPENNKKKQEEEQSDKQKNKKEKATVYIGYDQIGYQEYKVEIEGEITPEKLIASIAELTGWNLSLADDVSSGKSGMTVNFSNESALVVGPPEKQKEEFRVYDIFSFTDLALDSIKETLQRNYVMEPCDPEILDVFYTLDGQAITVDGVVIPMEEPWESGRFGIQE